MKILKSILSVTFLASVIFLSSCGNEELQKDAEAIGDAMCKNIGIMNDIRKSDQVDSLSMDSLQKAAKDIRIEMTILYNEFNAKYGEKTKDEKFNKEFAQELKKAMLGCPNLSAEDRDKFEKEME